jgi:homoserine dehydrogenase
MTKPLNIAVAGLGNVGAKVVTLIQQQAEILEQRSGRAINIAAVSARNPSLDRGFDLTGLRWVSDPLALAAEPEIDVVVELIGGSEGPARHLVERALSAGKHVVTANKALLAHHGTALAEMADRHGCVLAFEAAVAGALPIIKSLREGLAGNRVREVHGILNGTCNYILTEMRETGRSFAEVLSEAQKLGYAEADPSFDVDGVDSAHKLAILTAVTFGCAVNFAAVHVEGIRHISPLDIAYASELGLRIKLLGIARRTDRGIEQRVHPCLVPQQAPIAAAEGVFNAVVADGDFADKVLLVGRGAGGGPTASAVAADLVDIARGRRTPPFGIPASALEPLRPAAIADRVGAYYLRLMVVDRPGVIADVSAALRDHAVSLESVLQRARSPDQPVPVVLTTHETREADLMGAVSRIAALAAVVETPRVIRIEQF